MFEVLPSIPIAKDVTRVNNSGLRSKYTGVIFYQLSGYVDNNGVFVYPTYQERLIEGLKPDNQKRFHFVEFCEPVNRVYADTQHVLQLAAYRFVKDDGLPFDYMLHIINNKKKRKHERIE